MTFTRPIHVHGEMRQSFTGHASDSTSGEVLSAYRKDGVYRLHEIANGGGWDWKPPLRSVAFPLRAGRTWSSASTSMLPNVSGASRATEVHMSTRVVRAASVSIHGHEVATWVLQSTSTIAVTDVALASGQTASFTIRRESMSWLAPALGVVVKSVATESVHGRDAQGRGDYDLKTDLVLQNLDPKAG